MCVHASTGISREMVTEDRTPTHATDNTRPKVLPTCGKSWSRVTGSCANDRADGSMFGHRRATRVEDTGGVGATMRMPVGSKRFSEVRRKSLLARSSQTCCSRALSAGKTDGGERD